MSSTAPPIRVLLRSMLQHGASDLHLKVGSSAAVRVDGALVPLAGDPLTHEDLGSYATVLMSDSIAPPALDGLCEFDCSYSLGEDHRFRVNLYRQRGGLAAVVRAIPSRVPKLDELSLPGTIRTLAERERGLILVTGATGSGKSTTLAAMIDHINRHRSCHILTIEDPIEFVFRGRKASISQREVGSDTRSFEGALRSALRQDPDVLMVGEMRDKSSVDTALAAAETGHLVMATMHTTDAVRSINRLFSFFGAQGHAELRDRLGDALQGIVSQRLLRSTDQGRVPAVEILVASAAVRQLLREGQPVEQLRDLMQSDGGARGMQTFDQHLMELFRNGKVDYETAAQAATSPTDFRRLVGLMQAETDALALHIERN